MTPLPDGAPPPSTAAEAARRTRDAIARAGDLQGRIAPVVERCLAEVAQAAECHLYTVDVSLTGLAPPVRLAVKRELEGRGFAAAISSDLSILTLGWQPTRASRPTTAPTPFPPGTQVLREGPREVGPPD